jgi:hypothetical protein
VSHLSLTRKTRGPSYEIGSLDGKEI